MPPFTTGPERITEVTGVHEVHEAVGKYVVEAKLPTLGAIKADSYEGDGYVIVRHERTDAVQAMIKKIIETMNVRYGG